MLLDIIIPPPPKGDNYIEILFAIMIIFIGLVIYFYTQNTEKKLLEKIEKAINK